MVCSICGHENRDLAKFCDDCGATLDATIARPAGDPELEAIRGAFSERYIVESLLGRGGMGSVYKARERTLDRHVALKIVRDERRSDAEFIERFRREARIAARLRHPRIVSVHEVGALGGYHYFSMDYIEGSTLRAVVARRRSLPPEDAMSVIAEICRAVAHAHGKGIIHRDLKPENVMIDTEGDVFVMDFGLARAVADSTLTASGAVVGSPYYMSPEQLRGEALDERTDVYSLGLILYYCITGVDLFAAESITAIIAKHMSTEVPLEVSRQDMPHNLREVLVNMLEENRDRRARTVKEVLERITLRKIVALGLAATDPVAVTSDASTMRISPPPAAAPAQPVEEQALAVAAERRKARLRSLLDDL
jgi:serine/threonine-protein kinase